MIFSLLFNSVQIHFWGHGVKLFVVSPATLSSPCLPFHFHCPQPPLSPWTIQLCSPSSSRPFVPLTLSVRVLCASVISHHIAVHLLVSSECQAFFSESSLWPRQIGHPWRAILNMQSNWGLVVLGFFVRGGNWKQAEWKKASIPSACFCCEKHLQKHKEIVFFFFFVFNLHQFHLGSTDSQKMFGCVLWCNAYRNSFTMMPLTCSAR